MTLYTTGFMIKQKDNTWKFYERFTNMTPDDVFSIGMRDIEKVKLVDELSDPKADHFTTTWGYVIWSTDGNTFTHGTQSAGTWMPPAEMLAASKEW
jgi:hypothetical protein